MGQRIDIDVEHFEQADAYLLTPVSPAGRQWVALNVSPKSPRRGEALICEPHEMPYLYEEIAGDGLVIC